MFFSDFFPQTTRTFSSCHVTSRSPFSRSSLFCLLHATCAQFDPSILFRSYRSPSDPSTSNPPILSVPYELLDLILSHFSSGLLSSNQHGLVMNWAEDRSTLGINKVDSRTDFLWKTNCWTWESEVEMVNLGHGYE
jgi:hypothetical protein